MIKKNEKGTNQTLLIPQRFSEFQATLVGCYSLKLCKASPKTTVKASIGSIP